MGSSFINIKEKGFWARDGFVEAMQLCLIEEIENQNFDCMDWITAYKNELALQALPLVYGGMSMELEEFFTTDERKHQLIELIDLIIEKIGSTNDYLTGHELHEKRKRAMTILSETGKIDFKDQEEFEKIVNYSRWKEAIGIPAVKHIYQHSFRLLRKLVNGEMNSTTSSPQDYWIG